jgi:hypothetical protein
MKDIKDGVTTSEENDYNSSYLIEDNVRFCLLIVKNEWERVIKGCPNNFKKGFFQCQVLAKFLQG